MTAAILVSGSDRRPGLALAAAVAAEAGGLTGGATLFLEVGERVQQRRPTLLAASGARRVEDAVREGGGGAAARGHFCHSAVGEADRLPEVPRLIEASAAEVAVIHVPGSLWVPSLNLDGLPIAGGLLLVSLPAERSLAALAVEELTRRGLRARVATRPPAGLAARRAVAGIRPGGRVSESASRVLRSLLGLGHLGATRGGLAQGGQALPAVLGLGLGLILVALILASIGGAITGKGRVQRAADLVALSAARSMRDDIPRLLSPPLLPDGRPNPRHLSRAQYLGRARLAAISAARHNGVEPARLEIAFPDAAANPPLRSRVTVRGEIDIAATPAGERTGERRPIPVVASAVAEASPPSASWTGLPAVASGGGYSGPLVYRNGEGMRPDVAAAFDRMAAAASRSDIGLVVVSGFRSDAEQAALFERHPDPRWVAPPGRSLHRCATELDLGPSSAYAWLAANARSFGFLQRYSWEAWHYGFVAGPPPCSEAGNSGGERAASSGESGGSGLPGFVPAQYLQPLLRSAARWNVSAGMLAAQLLAESAFNPRAVSPAGALGIAQFMPATARSYGLRDPFDPDAAIDAQAHLMSDLLRRFRSIPLALAGYNAGPGAVAACSCVPPYPETQAYVARILALMDGAGVMAAPPLEVRLVR